MTDKQLDIHEAAKYILKHLDGIDTSAPVIQAHLARLRQLEAAMYRAELAKLRSTEPATTE
jgi:hypothetical protein